MDKEIRIFIYKLRKRLGIQKAMNIFPLVLSTGFFLGFLHLFFGYFYPFYYAGMLAGFWIVVSILFGIIYFFLHFPKEQEAAHMGDTVIGQERLLTALELRGKEEPISCLQKEDTISRIAVCNIKESFPYQLHFKQLLLCIFIVSLFFLFLYLPSKAKLEAEKLHALKQDKKEELTLLDKAEKEITQEKTSEKQAPSALETSAKDDNLDLDTIKELLEQTKKEYSSADSKQELQKAKERLRVKLENLAEKEISLEKQATISDFMEEMGFSPYHNLNNSKESKTTSLSENTSALNETETQKQMETSSNQNENHDSNNTDNTSNNENSNYDNSSNSNHNDNSNHENDINSTNNNNNNKQSSDPDAAANPSKNQSGNRKGNDSYGKTGKNHGSKKGIERKSKKKEAKEKVMVVPDTTSQDEALTGVVSQDGNSYQQSSDQQLSFGKKENLEKVEKEYAKDALTTIDNNNSIPMGMKDIVQSYFSQIK